MSNAVLGRRVFLGSAGAAAIAGFGALNLQLAAQPAPPADPLIRELYRQLKLGMGKMLDGEGEGARQLASTLRIYAMTVSDDEIRANLRAATRARGRQAFSMRLLTTRRCSSSAGSSGSRCPCSHRMWRPTVCVAMKRSRCC